MAGSRSARKDWYMLKQIEPHRVHIGDVEYAIYPFPAMKSAGISGDLIKFIGPLIAGITPVIGKWESIDKFLDEDIVKVLPLISGALQTLDANSVERILSELLLDYKNISCEYRDDSGHMVQRELTKELADDLFIGGLQDMIRLAVEVVKLNFGGFFTGLLTQPGSLGGQQGKSASLITGNTTEVERIL